MIKLVGIGGVARAGKDTFCKILIDILKEKGMDGKRFAFADTLKDELNPFLIEKFGVDVWNCSSEEKEAIRPMLVAYGKCKRIMSQGTYWTSIVSDKMKDQIGYSKKTIPIVTDVRYQEYKNDEGAWIKKMGGVLIHITRESVIERWEPSIGKPVNGTTVKRFGDNDVREVYHERSYIEPANQEEEINDPKILQQSDFSFVWKTSDNYKYLKKEVEKFLEQSGIMKDLIVNGV